jgi:hypothetical protein
MLLGYTLIQKKVIRVHFVDNKRLHKLFEINYNVELISSLSWIYTSCWIALFVLDMINL